MVKTVLSQLRPRVQSLVRELKSHKPHGRQKKRKREERERKKFQEEAKFLFHQKRW